MLVGSGTVPVGFGVGHEKQPSGLSLSPFGKAVKWTAVESIVRVVGEVESVKVRIPIPFGVWMASPCPCPPAEISNGPCSELWLNVHPVGPEKFVTVTSGVLLKPNAIMLVFESVEVFVNFTVNVFPLRVNIAVAVLPGNPAAVYKAVALAPPFVKTTESAFAELADKPPIKTHVKSDNATLR
jgi:hypothetical protein